MGSYCLKTQKQQHTDNMKFLWVFALFFAVISAQKLKNCRPAKRIEVEAKWPAKQDFSKQLDQIRDQDAKSNQDKYSKYSAAQILNFEELAEKFDDKLVEKWLKSRTLPKLMLLRSKHT